MRKILKRIINKYQEKIEPSILKSWLKIRVRSLKILSFLEKRLLWIFLFPFLVIFLFLSFKYQKQITEYLITQGFTPTGESTGIFNTIFITLGASILGVLAIIFSLSLFAIQQATEKYTSAILSGVLKDRTNKIIFLSIASISLIFFLFAIFPLESVLFYQAIFSFILLVSIFILLRKYYIHTVNLINPVSQILLHYNKAAKTLFKIDKELDLMIKAKIIQSPPHENKDKEKQQESNNDVNLLKAGLIFRIPNLFEGVKNCIEQIYNLIHTYIHRKDYQVTRTGFNAIYSLVSKYIDIRNGTFFPSSIISDYDLSHDDFLTYVFERLTHIHQVSLREKDLEISTQVLDCFSNIAIKCTSIQYRTIGVSEYAHCMLTVVYMQRNIEDSLKIGLLDIGVRGSENLKKIGLILINKNAHTDVRMIIEKLQKIAMHGIIQPNASFLISYPMQAYSIFLRAIIFNKNVYDHFLTKKILKKTQEIITLYVKFKDLKNLQASVDMQYSIGNFIDLSKPIAMPYLFDESYVKIEDEKTIPEEKKNIVSKILNFSDELWRFYEELSKYAAEKESFLIHFIDSNIFHITMSCLKLYQSSYLDDLSKKTLLKNVSWLISDYWRIYDYHKKITSNYHFQILENLLIIGFEFNKLKLIKELEQVIDIIVSIGCSFLKKQKNGCGFDPIRIIEKAAYLCILNGTEEIGEEFITKLKTRFWHDFIEKYPHHKSLLFDELSNIEPDKLRLEYNFSFENRLLSQLDKSDILKFVEKMRKNLP